MSDTTLFSRLRRLARYYRPYQKLFWTDMFCAVLTSICALLLPLLVRQVTNHTIKLPPEEAVWQLAGLGTLMLFIILVTTACNYYITYYGHSMGVFIERDLRNEIFAHYQKLSFSFYDNQKVGHLLSRVTNDLFEITELLHHGPEDIVISLLRLGGSFIILFAIDWRMALVALAFIPPLLLHAGLLNFKMKRAFTENRARIADINSQLEDSLAGIRVVKSFGNEPLERENFSRGNENFVRAKRNSYRYIALYHAGMDTIITIIVIAVILAGAYCIMHDSMQIGDLLTFLLYIDSFIEPVRKLVQFTEQFQNGYSGYERFLEMMAIEPDIKDAPNALALPPVQGEIVFDKVSFHYRERAGDVLSQVNLKVDAGEYVALAGSSGAGKTTLCSLIPRFYEVSSGVIRIDGHDIRDVQLASLRSQIGIVQQDVYLFAGTVLENIRYGRPGAPDSAVINAAKAANAHDFIMDLPQGYDTDIGQRGIKLSGGQKQRLAIARVFLKDPPILIFDEATSALDNESERTVRESLRRLAQGRTTLVIAHRLSTIRHAHRILVLTGNGIAEEGSHEELMARRGIYWQLYQAQFET